MAVIIEEFWVDLVEGTPEDDTVTINGGARTVDLTQGGNDVLNINAWIETVLMGDFNDSVFLSFGAGTGSVDLGDGTNIFDSTGGGLRPEGGYVETITSGKGSFAISIGSNGAGTIEIDKKSDGGRINLDGYLKELIGGNGTEGVFVADGVNVGSLDLAGGDDKVESTGYVNNIDAGKGSDDITVGSANTVDLGRGNDFFESTGYVNSIDAGLGNDNIFVGGANTVDLGGGRDFFSSSGYVNTLSASGGSDQVNVNGAGFVTLGSGNDNFFSEIGGAWVNRVEGGSGRDSFVLGGGGNAYGGSGKDTFTGAFGSDNFFGESSNDLFIFNENTKGAYDFYDGGTGDRDRLIIQVDTEEQKNALEAELEDFESGEDFYISSLNLRIVNIEKINIEAPTPEIDLDIDSFV